MTDDGDDDDVDDLTDLRYLLTKVKHYFFQKCNFQ